MVGVIAVVLFFTIGNADIAMPQYGVPSITSALSTTTGLFAQYYSGVTKTFTTDPVITQSKSKTVHVLLPMSFATYLISIFSFLGSIMFTVFFSIGLAALPIDKINVWRKRPVPLPKSQL